MALSTTQRALFEKSRQRGAGDQGISLSDEAVRGLISVIADDLGLQSPVSGCELAAGGYFYTPVEEVIASGDNPLVAFGALVDAGPVDTDLYFFSLAALHRARLKYHNILRLQATPSLEQVGPRGLLQFGSISAASLGSLLVMRKWMFDVDNRAAQETGYLFEPIIAGAIGGVPASARRSPVKRGGTGPGRQVDCLRDASAYEIKMRVTIAASGQGRWGEELAFPEDCRLSGYVPVLIVFDSTANPKLLELAARFESNGGQAYVGDEAWAHLETESGATMAAFIERYVRVPLDALLAETPEDLPEVALLLKDDFVRFTIGSEVIELPRLIGTENSSEDEIPDDVADTLPGL